MKMMHQMKGPTIKDVRSQGGLSSTDS